MFSDNRLDILCQSPYKKFELPKLVFKKFFLGFFTWTGELYSEIVETSK